MGSVSASMPQTHVSDEPSMTLVAQKPPWRFCEDHLAQREIGDCLSEPRILLLRLLVTFHLVDRHPAVLLPPAVAGDLADAWLLDSPGGFHSLWQQHFRLSELGDDPLRGVPLPRHCAYPAIPKTLAQSFRTGLRGLGQSAPRRISATAGRVNSSGIAAPSRSNSRSFVPERKTWCSFPWGQVFELVIWPHARQ